MKTPRELAEEVVEGYRTDELTGRAPGIDLTDRIEVAIADALKDAREEFLNAEFRRRSESRFFDWARALRRALLEANRRRHAARAKTERERVDILSLQGELFEHLSLIVRYLEEETSQGDGIAEEHFDGYTAAKALLKRASERAELWENAQLALEDLRSETREACARICDERARLNAGRARRTSEMEAEICAAAIRAGGQS